MSKKINNKYFFSAFPLILGMFFLTLISLQYLGLVINPHALEYHELSKEELRMPEEMHDQIIAQKKMVAKVVGFANFLPDPLNRLGFATIPTMCFFWLFLLFRKFGKDGIALDITDSDLIIRTYRGAVILPRTEITEVIKESPSEIEFKTVHGDRYMSTSTISDTSAQMLKENLDVWMAKDYTLVEVSDEHELNPMDHVPDIHGSLTG